MSTRNQRQMRWCSVIAVTIGLFCSAQTEAGKPSKLYTLVQLPDAEGSTELDGYAHGMNEVLIDGQLKTVEVVGSLAGHAYHWGLDAQGNVMMTTPLLPTDQITEAHDVNDQGIVVGGGFFDGAMLPLAWLSLGDEPIALPIPAGLTGIAVNINDNGMVVGLLEKENLEEPDLYTQLAVAWQLTEDEIGPTFVGPVLLSEASTILPTPDLNDAGQVVATVKVGGTFQGQRWSVHWDGEQLTASPPEVLTGTMIDENGQPRTVSLRSMAINEAGDICGKYAAADGPSGAFLLLFDGTLIDLPPLDGKRLITQSNNAYDLNDAADIASIQVVGDVAFFDTRGFYLDTFPAVWQSSSVMDLEAKTYSDLKLVGIDRISNHGWLAGYAGDLTTPRAAVVVPK